MYSNDDERHLGSSLLSVVFLTLTCVPLACLKRSLACTRAGGCEADIRRLEAAIQRATPEVERLWGKASLT
jgi:hypothetical protein